MRVRFADRWIADSEDVVLLHEPGRYPVAYFPKRDIEEGILVSEDRVTQHKDLGETQWFSVRVSEHEANHSAWQHTGLPDHAAVLDGRQAFAWRAMEAFYEEDERIVGHAADAYHRIDIRSTSRHLVVRDGDLVIADTQHPLALYESGFAPRWYVPREDIDTHQHSNPQRDKLSARTRASPPTMTSATANVRPGPTSTHGRRWAG
jgi:uncharacterized protein (DUF427 family)